MTRKTEVSLAVLILLILLAVLLFLFRQKESVQTNTQTDTAAETVSGTATDTTEPVVVPPSHATPSTISRIFVERFGSYSTDVDYANVTDVLPLVTDGLKSRLQSIAEDARKTANESYYGVSTNVIKITTDEQTETAMTLTVKTQREEAFGTPGNTSVRYQDIRVEFVKIGDDWFVDDFEWLSE